MREFMRNLSAPRYVIPSRVVRTGLDACVRCKESGLRCSRLTMRLGFGQGGSAEAQRLRKRDEPCSRYEQDAGGCCAEYLGRGRVKKAGQVGRGEGRRSGSRERAMAAPKRTMLIDGVETDVNQFAVPVPDPSQGTVWPEWWTKMQEKRPGVE